ncbi:dihydrolipoamide acetyltransferase component of pyruvate dehydrogenase complex [Lentzea sp. NBRC 105346]|uniref:2-oxo acid dehydrogenase subunit E2 n=1 Tax=Lentzea sp. NBRC 105346 TaxID=3032205 RepID=UPI0024A320EA|nr:2-oxo acid dehydrogenase subunit E2 [Lentzea sp. NBRC 105346]GLZ31997.1 dihydrolipoamide acetyltransferase component of pyruvate dehydrogenase complex [Lentzea sp. NBRC 105346]
MIDIEVPKLNNNDTTYVLVEWLAEDGQRLEEGDPVAVVETSKAAEELCCEHGGVLQRLVTATPADCGQGDVIAHLFASETERQEFLANQSSTKPSTVDIPVGLPTLTEPARLLAEQHGVEPAALARLGLRVVREADVRRLLSEASKIEASSGGEAKTHTPNRAQRAVAAAVSQSHQEIPAAFTAAVVTVDSALATARELSERTGALIGLPELLVAVLGRLHERFPLCYGTPTAEGTLLLPEAAHVAITVDVGRGLFAPVVKRAGEQPLDEISGLLMDYRIKAMREAFQTEDLNGANILLSLNNDDDILFAQPIVFPGQTCAVALGGTRREAVFADDGSVTSRSVAVVGLAYDHRFVNGSTAVEFLKAIKVALESPATFVRGAEVGADAGDR